MLQIKIAQTICRHYGHFANENLERYIHFLWPVTTLFACSVPNQKQVSLKIFNRNIDVPSLCSELQNRVRIFLLF